MKIDPNAISDLDEQEHPLAEYIKQHLAEYDDEEGIDLIELSGELIQSLADWLAFKGADVDMALMYLQEAKRHVQKEAGVQPDEPHHVDLTGAFEVGGKQ